MRHILLMLALAVSASGQQEKAPTPKIHATDAKGGGFSLEATCPAGWHSELSKASIARYDKSAHTYADAINVTLESTCVKGDKPKPSGHAVSTHTKAGK